jgi:glycosyltransferase involved in cell wall biosynthesis
VKRIKILRIIARLNMGGPAHHVGLLSGLLDPSRYETLLATGRVGPGEASLAQVAERFGTRPYVLRSLGPELDPLKDGLTLRDLIGLIRAFRPDIVHTHTAKAGIVGRAAAVIAPGERPLIVHTYHGHVLEGYFGRAQAAVYRGLEHAAARPSDCLIGVSQGTVDDLVRLRVAPRARFRVIPLGLDLAPFLELSDSAGLGLRSELGLADDEILATFVGRLVAIKRVDVLLRAQAHARSLGAPLRLAVVGDGPLRASLEKLAHELGVGPSVSFLGYRRDMTAVAAATDIGVLASDNEGTPVSLIELAAAGRPVVATDVGGVADVVTPETGLLADRGDAVGLGQAVARLALNPADRAGMGRSGRQHVASRYSASRLVADIDALYGELLATRGL